MCEIAIGTDTGGSTRIPAALCGIVGYKPSQQRVPTEGAFPLSYTLDSIGPIARTVADCARGRCRDGRRGRGAAAAGAAERVCGSAFRKDLLLRDFDNTVGTRFGAATKKPQRCRCAAHR